MRRILGALGVLAILIGSGAAAGAAVGGLDAAMTLDPTSGPAGTVFTVSGSDCTPGDGGDMSVELAAEGTVESKTKVVPNEAGDWSTTLTADGSLEVGTVIDVDAACVETFGVGQTAFQGFRSPAGNLGSVRFGYTTAQFTVIAATTTTESTTTTEAETTTTEAPAEVDATAAEATVAQPTFTG